MIALSWIKNSKHPKNYVRERVRDILETSPQAEFRHVGGSLNCADRVTRGLTF